MDEKIGGIPMQALNAITDIAITIGSAVLTIRAFIEICKPGMKPLKVLFGLLIACFVLALLPTAAQTGVSVAQKTSPALSNMTKHTFDDVANDLEKASR
jgi:hypothetical protein